MIQINISSETPEAEAREVRELIGGRIPRDIFQDIASLQEQMTEVTDRIVSLEAMQADSGWRDLPLLNGATAYNDALRPQYRRIGKQIFLRGVAKNMTSADFVFAQLPIGYRPDTQYFFIGSSITIDGKATFYTCQISVNGQIRINHSSSGQYNANNYVRLTTSFLVD